MLIPLLVFKFAVYSLWCGIGLRIFEGPAPAGQTHLWQALYYGVLRIVIGFGLFGYFFSVLLAGPTMALLWAAPVVRLLEWSMILIFFLIKRRKPPEADVPLDTRKAAAWVVGGVAVSFLLDLLLVPLGLGSLGRIC